MTSGSLGCVKRANYAIAAVVIVILAGATVRVAVERNSGTPSEQSEPITLAQADSLRHTKLCAMISEEIVPAFYGDVEKWGVAQAIAEFESARDEVLASGDAQKIADTKTLERWVPGIFKHVAAAHSLLGRFDGRGVDATKHATDTYMTSCLLLGPENVN
jgi:hypothetical protein